MYHETIKIRDLSPESPAWKKVRGSLNQAAVMIGSVSVLSDNEYLLMKDFLSTEYKDFSPEEMLIAFKKVSSGAITVDIDHFGKLSPMYLGAVLKAFKVERHKALAKELKERPKEEMITTQEDKNQARTNFLNNCLFKPYSGIKEKGFFDVDRFVAKQLYQIFLRANLFKVTDQEEKHYFDLAEKDLYNDAKKDHKSHKPILKFMESIKEMNSGKSNTMLFKIVERASVLYFYDYILKLHENKRDIKEIAKQL